MILNIKMICITDFDKEQGKIFIELAMVLPLLLYLLFGVIEINRAMKVHQITSRISYEMASIALRNCGVDNFLTTRNIKKENSRTNLCIENNLAIIASKFESIKDIGGFTDTPYVAIQYYIDNNLIGEAKFSNSDIIDCAQNNTGLEQEGLSVRSVVGAPFSKITPIPLTLSELLYGRGGICSIVEVF